MGNFTNSRDPDEMPHDAAFHLSKKLKCKDQEYIQSSNTPDPGYHVGK